jgi:hypothetical protein
MHAFPTIIISVNNIILTQMKLHEVISKTSLNFSVRIHIHNVKNRKKGILRGKSGDVASLYGLNVQDTHIALKLYAFS